MRIASSAVSVAALAVVLTGCGSSEPAGTSSAATSTGAASTASSAEDLTVPEEGTPAERLKALWSRTKPIVERDAKGGYDDEEYMRRRRPLWSAWTSLQMSLAGEDDRVSRIIPRVLELLNQAYGWTAYSPEERAKRRANEGRTAKLIEEIDEEIGKL